MGQHCLQQRLLKHLSRQEKQTTFVAIGVLRVNVLPTSLHVYSPTVVLHALASSDGVI